MNALDDIRIRAGAGALTEAEALAVIDRCYAWISGTTHNPADLPELLRVCDREMPGGIKAALRDIRWPLEEVRS